MNGWVCQNGKIHNITKGAAVAAKPGALVLVKDNKGTVKQLEAGKTYNYVSISKMFPKKSNFSSAVAEVIFAPNKSTVQTGGVYRSGGMDRLILQVMPADGQIVLADSIRFEVIPKDKGHILGSGLLFPEDNPNDTTHISIKPNGIKLPTPSRGNYSWGFSLSVSGSGGLIPFFYKFTVPNSMERQLYLEEWDIYRKSIAGFSSEMKELLEEEYLQQKNLYVKHQ